MAAQQLSEWYECGYCVSKRDDMRDPRELPCQHVFCLSCIQGHYSKHKTVTCPTCGKVYDSLEIEGLPKVTIGTGDSGALYCTADGCQGQIATCYCVKCEVMFCTQHQQVHKMFLGDSHKVVDIDVYKSSPKNFNKPTCEHHQEVLVRACKKCDKLICFECEIDGEDCTDGGKHDFKSLTSLKVEVNEYLRGKLETVSQKIDEVYSLDKKAWRELDVQEKKCGAMAAEIEKVRDEMIQRIRQESQEMIDKVTNHKEKMTAKVEGFHTKLMKKEEGLKKTQAELTRLLKDGHVTEKIRQKKKITDELERNDADKLDDCELADPPTLIHTGEDKNRLLNVSLVTVPSSLELVSELETVGGCYSANHRQDGDILIGTKSGIQLLSRDGNELSEYSTSEKQVSGVIETPQNVFILHREDDISKVDMCLAGDITKKQQLFQFNRTSNGAAVMAVSDRHVVVNHLDTKQLIIYDFITKQTETIHPDVFPLGLHFLPDGHLLGVGKDKLIKYKVENGKLTTVWTCDGVAEGYGVWSDPNGLIYVCANRSVKAVYIISPKGYLLKKLIHDKLPKLVGAISVKDDTLAVPCWDENMLRLFRTN